MFTRIDAYLKLVRLQRESKLTDEQVEALEKGLKHQSLKMCNYTLGLIAKL